MPVPGYASWSVVAGAQPTTAYWNILGSNDAAFNTFLTGQNIKSTLLALSNTLDSTNGVQSFTNGGTGGGTFYYINLGGIKLLWGQVNSVIVAAGSYQYYAVNFPSSFFSTIQSATANNAGVGTNFANTIVSATVPTTSGVTIGMQNISGTASNGVIGNLLVIGT